MPKKRLYTIGFVLWLVMIAFVCLSTFPSDEGPAFEIPNLDKAVHFFLYLIATLLGTGFIREQFKGRFTLHQSILKILFFLIIFGIIIEVIQMEFTTTRSGEVNDVLANVAGALTAGTLLRLFYSGKRAFK